LEEASGVIRFSDKCSEVSVAKDFTSSASEKIYKSLGENINRKTSSNNVGGSGEGAMKKTSSF